MSNHKLRPWRAQALGACSRSCYRRPCHPSWSSKCSQQAVSASTADGRLPSFSFRITAKQAASTKLRLDTFLAVQIAADLAAGTVPAAARTQDVSRAKIQACIAAGLVLVNGRIAVKASQQLRPGDSVVCSLTAPPPVQALPEAIPLDIKYEDDHIIVVNKPAGMVVHVAPGHYSGTLVNALLHHCALPALDMDLDLDPSLDLDLVQGLNAAPSLSGAGGGSGDSYLYDDDDCGNDGDSDGGDDGEEYLENDVEPSGDGGCRPLAPAISNRRSSSSSSSSSSRSEGIGSKSGLASSVAIATGAAVAGPFHKRSSDGSSNSSSSSRSLGAGSSILAVGGGVGVVDDDYSSSLRSGTRSSSSSSGCSTNSCLRPGIVHRLDKGTSGLLVVAKTELALTRLQAQFKARTVDRLYESITVGCPLLPQGHVETNICRDPGDRKRMAAAPYGSGRGRTAGSTYTVLAPLAGGGAALVIWKLETGRTHQIRVHAKYMGHPLLGDDTYGGTAPAALAMVARKYPADTVRRTVEQLGRPALHARTLGFIHPVTGTQLSFEQLPPEDFVRALSQLGEGMT